MYRSLDGGQYTHRPAWPGTVWPERASTFQYEKVHDSTKQYKTVRSLQGRAISQYETGQNSPEQYKLVQASTTVRPNRLGIDVSGPVGWISEDPERYGGRYGSLEIGRREFLEGLSSIDEYTVVDELSAIEDRRIVVIGGSGAIRPAVLQEVVEAGCDVLITGDGSFQGRLYAFERGLTLVELGETSSERWGEYALGEVVRDHSPAVECHRIDERNW